MSPLNSQPKSVFDKINIGKIGKGRLYTEGSWHKTMGSGTKDSGLKGQLKKVKRLGCRTTTKNLSDKNIKQIHSLISDRIKKKGAGSGSYLSRADKIAIMKESRELVKTKGSNFTYEDRKDLMKIVDTLQSKGKEAVFQRSNNIDKSLPSNQQSYPIKNKIVSNSSNDFAREFIYKVDGMRRSSLQQSNNVANGELLPNSKDKISITCKVTQPAQDKFLNENNVIDKQKRPEQEETTYGFINATKGEVKLDSDSPANEEVELDEELEKSD